MEDRNEKMKKLIDMIYDIPDGMGGNKRAYKKGCGLAAAIFVPRVPCLHAVHLLEHWWWPMAKHGASANRATCMTPGHSVSAVAPEFNPNTCPRRYALPGKGGSITLNAAGASAAISNNPLYYEHSDKTKAFEQVRGVLFCLPFASKHVQAGGYG